VYVSRFPVPFLQDARGGYLNSLASSSAAHLDDARGGYLDSVASSSTADLDDWINPL